MAQSINQARYHRQWLHKIGDLPPDPITGAREIKLERGGVYLLLFEKGEYSVYEKNTSFLIATETSREQVVSLANELIRKHIPQGVSVPAFAIKKQDERHKLAIVNAAQEDAFGSSDFAIAVTKNELTKEHAIDILKSAGLKPSESILRISN